jgi:hypothetical protein
MRPGRALPTRYRVVVLTSWSREGWVSPGFTIARAEYRLGLLSRGLSIARLYYSEKLP